MAKVIAISFICCLPVWIACNNHQKKLVGSWNAHHVLESGDSVELDLDNVSLVFKEDNTFSYRHTKVDSLGGSYHCDRGGLLFLFVEQPRVDTIILQIADLSDDDLQLRMNHEGKERLVVMKK